MVLSAEPVSVTISDGEDEHFRTSTAQIAATWPDKVITGDPSNCHILAVLSQEPLRMNPGRTARAQTAKQIHKLNYNVL